MTDERQQCLWTIFHLWEQHNERLCAAIEPLSIDQLALRPAPHLRSIGENTERIIEIRANWFYEATETGSDVMETLDTWGRPDVGPRSSIALSSALRDSWDVVRRQLKQWKVADLAHIYTGYHNEKPFQYTRLQLIWGTLERDMHHGGEISYTLDIHHLHGLRL